MRGEYPRRPTAVLASRSTITMIVGAILLWGADGVAQTSPEVVFPTGDYPADVRNVQAAVDLGGTVLLKAINVAGLPTVLRPVDAAHADRRDAGATIRYRIDRRPSRQYHTLQYGQ